jgi:polysaccharide biosynthesis transport protein
METATHLSDYLVVLRRRRAQVLRVAAAVFGLAVLLAILLPTVYRATAKLLIEQEMAPDLVPSTVTGYVNQRIKIIETRVLTPENLAKVAEKAGIFEKERAAGKVREVGARMRDHIKVETVSANVTDPRSGATSTATVALNVSYDASSPDVAQKAAQELGTLFVNENRVVRTAKAQRTSGFLGEEEQRLRQHIDELEAKLAEYKEKNRGQLPELMNLNMQMFERSQRELEEAERQIYALEERKVQLQSQLALVEPHTGNSPGGRLREVEAQYLSASSVYSPDHPDVVRLKRELDSLKKQMGVSDSRAAVEGEYKKATQDLAAAREKYAEDHPSVAQLKKRVATLETQMRKAPPPRSGFSVRPDNPAYVNLQTQIDTVELNLRAAKEQRASAQQKIKDYETRLVQTPRVEQEGLALQREYESAVKKYREIKQSLMSAELALELEKEQRGERYSILEPPERPDSPHSPNRRAIILLGLVLGLGAGVGYASVAEYMDRTIRGARGVAGLLQAPPLAVIPYIPNGIDSTPRGA